MTRHNTAARQAPATTELMTKAEVAEQMRRTPAGVDRLRARDSDFPKPLKYGPDRRARVYFVRGEIEAYLAAKLQAREASA